jgi:NAD(P)H dehydrogenase (quinone)
VQVLVVHAHPDSDSYSTALRDAAVRGLEKAGHDVTVLDLYAEAFVPAMSAAEQRAYESGDPISDGQVAAHANLLRSANALVFVYPTWWFGMPAIMKGWLERVFVPGVAFHLDDRTNKVRSGLRNITHLVGITTTGSPRWQVRLLGDTGRWTVKRTTRLLASWRCRTTWLALDRLDSRPDEHRRAFLDKVENRMAAL